MSAGFERTRLRDAAWPRVDLRLVVGLALVLAAIGGGLTLWRRAQVTTPVIVAIRELAPGRVLTAEDVTTAQARLEGPLAGLVFGAGELDGLIGRTVTGAVHAGALVLRPDVGSGPVIGPGELAVTVPVRVDAVYAHLRRGDEVAVMATSDKGKAQSLTTTLLERATVYDVGFDATRVSIGADRHEEDGRLSNVTLVVPRSAAERVAHAVVNAELTVLLLPPERTGGPS